VCHRSWVAPAAWPEDRRWWWPTPPAWQPPRRPVRPRAPGRDGVGWRAPECPATGHSRRRPRRSGPGHPRRRCPSGCDPDHRASRGAADFRPVHLRPIRQPMRRTIRQPMRRTTSGCPHLGWRFRRRRSPGPQPNRRARSSGARPRSVVRRTLSATRGALRPPASARRVLLTSKSLLILLTTHAPGRAWRGLLRPG
jgi:hypothetical protein